MGKATKSFDEEYDVVVIGSGIGGLSCGAFLAKSGKRVKVFERRPVSGGYCGSFEKDGFGFSRAAGNVHGCGTEGDLTRLLSELGLKEQIEFRQMKPTCKVFLADKTFTIPSGFDNWKGTLIKDFPGEEENIIKFINTMKGVAADLKKPPPPSSLVTKYQSKVAKDLIDEYLTDPLLKAAVSSIFYGGLPPSRLPAMLYCVSINNHLEHGCYIVEGGMQALADVFVSGIESFGGHLELNTGVVRILVEDGRAIGVETVDGRRVKADFIASNVAAMQTFGGLVGQREMAAIAPDFIDKLRGLEINVSSMIINIGTDLALDSLGITDVQTIVHESVDFEKEWENNAHGDMAGSPFAIFIPTLVDPSQAPPKKHVISIFAYAPYDLPGKHWGEEEARITDIMIKKAERVLPNLSKHILVQDTATPRTMEKYSLSTQGATSGWAGTLSNFPNRPEPKTPVEGLYLTGHWTTHGASVGSVALSGYKVAQMIISGQ